MHVADLSPPYLIVKPGKSEDDFYRLADEDSDWECLDGRIIMHSPASFQHENLFSFLLTLLRTCLEEKGGGIALGSRFPMRLDSRWSPEPDIMVVGEERRHQITQQRLEGPADFVIEIESESDPRLDLREKLPRYQEARIEEIWLIDPFRQELVQVVRQDSGYTTRSCSQGQVKSQAVEGFWIKPEWLWQESLPSVLACLRQLLDG
ncbi:MAG: Uma2 family endonuclease [Acidobacteriota bacterium]